jgi:hypothetical protein
MGKCQHDAGVLKNNELTEAAKNKFIKDVKAQLLMGSAQAPPLPIPCGPELPPVPHADRIELEIEELYPEWHAYALGYYRDIARGLDVEGQFTILPICDPIALGFKLGLDPPPLDFPIEFGIVGFALPLLAAHLEIIPPVELALKFPDLLSVGLPALEIPEFPLPPLEFPELFKFAFPFPKFPELLLGLMAKMPSLFLKLLAFDFSAPCDVVLDAGLFGPFDPNEAIVWAVTQKVLAAKTAECLTIALIGSTVGSAPAGMTGLMGRDVYGYTPPKQSLGEKPPIRESIVAYAQQGDGLSWSQDHADFKAKGYSLEKATFKYTSFLKPNWMFPKPPEVPYVHSVTLARINQAFVQAQKQSCCGMFVRVCYYYAGTTYHPFFTEPYQPAAAVAKLIQIAKKVGAAIDYGQGSSNGQFIPALKKGDSIIVQKTSANPANPQAGTEHVLILVEDYAGGLDGSVRTVEGGQADFGNTAAPNGSAINASRVEFKKLSNGSISASAIGDPEPRSIGLIMNGWSMATGLPKEDEGKADAPK